MRGERIGEKEIPNKPELGGCCRTWLPPENTGAKGQLISGVHTDSPEEDVHTHTHTRRQRVRTPLLGGTRPLQSKLFHSGGLGISSVNRAAGLLSSLLLELILSQEPQRLPFCI